jgi:hypothetical protein
MKSVFRTVVLLAVAIQSTAVAAGNVRLAVISDSPDASTVSDVLIPAFSGYRNVELIERDAILKVYREQGISVANRNEVKLGRILGADGLLLLKVVNNSRATNLTVRLIAVTTGVALEDSAFEWPIPAVPEWAKDYAAHVQSFLPKLTLLAKDAIPISLVNLRCAAASPGALELERAVTLLALRRLSAEPCLFVLERRKLQLLAQEKSLNADELVFWSGSYLLEGVIDQQGVSAGRLTIDARLLPANGRAPILFHIAAVRTNLADAVNQLASRITTSLQLTSTLPEWKPAAEASSFFEESKWAQRWRCYSEAQSAADTAWALGKTDLDCALARIEAYRAELAAAVSPIRHGASHLGPSHNNAGQAVTPPPDDATVQYAVDRVKSESPIGLAYRISRNPSKGETAIDYIFMDAPTDPVNLDRAADLLELYENLSGFLASEWVSTAPDVAAHQAKWQKAALEVLVAATQALQNFYFAPPAMPSSATTRLPEIRASARRIAQQVYASCPARKSYFAGTRVVGYEELERTIPGSIFECLVRHGAWWQETPDEAVALYRELMTSPVFSYLHQHLWLRTLENPRLVAWNESGRSNVSALWEKFVRELASSSNPLCQLEAKALALADAPDPDKAELAGRDLFAGMFERHDAFITNNIDVLYLEWRVMDLILAKTNGELSDETRKSLAQVRAMRDDWRKHLAEREHQGLVEKQAAYLQENRPYDFSEFARLFSSRRYSTNEATALQPLVAAYKSNLVSQAQSSSPTQQMQFRHAIAEVGFLETDIQHILSPSTNLPISTQAPQSAAQPVPVAAFPRSPAAPTNSPQALNAQVARVVVVNQFLPIPIEKLGDNITSATLGACHWQEDHLVADVTARFYDNQFDESGRFKSNRLIVRYAIAVLEPKSAQWQVTISRDIDELDNFARANPFGDRTVLCAGVLFTCDAGRVRRYDAATGVWQDVEACEPGNYALFGLNGRSFAVNASTVLEIIDHGKSTRVLASNRRRPAASLLDAEALGQPFLFEGPGHSLRACAGGKIVAWADTDWRALCPAPPHTLPLAFAPDGLLFVTDGWSLPWSISRLPLNADAPELCFGSLRQPGVAQRPNGRAANSDSKWNLPAGLNLPDLTVASRYPDLFLLVDHAATENVVHPRFGFTTKRAIPKDGYHAALLRFSTNSTAPLSLGLRFDCAGAEPPVTGEHPSLGAPANLSSPPWLMFTTQDLFLARRQTSTRYGGSGQSRTPIQIGVWRWPLTQLDQELALVRQSQPVEGR